MRSGMNNASSAKCVWAPPKPVPPSPSDLSKVIDAGRQRILDGAPYDGLYTGKQLDSPLPLGLHFMTFQFQLLSPYRRRPPCLEDCTRFARSNRSQSTVSYS